MRAVHVAHGAIVKDTPTTKAARAIAAAAKAWVRYQEEWDALTTADTTVEALDEAEAALVTKVALAFDAVREVLIVVPPPITMRGVRGGLIRLSQHEQTQLKRLRDQCLELSHAQSQTCNERGLFGLDQCITCWALETIHGMRGGAE